MRYIISISIFIFNLLDLVITKYFVDKFGLDLERNPIAKYVIHNMGWTFTSICKIMIGFLISYLYFTYWNDYRYKYIRISAYIILFIYSFVNSSKSYDYCFLLI